MRDGSREDRSGEDGEGEGKTGGVEGVPEGTSVCVCVCVSGQGERCVL